MNSLTTSRLDTVRSDINAALELYYAARIKRSAAMHEDYAVLWQTIHEWHVSGGKRLRPYVMLVAYEGLGGTNPKSVVPIATALELLHASLLIHDDIIDRDDIRYGRLNVAGQYKQRYATERLTVGERDHYANSAALLAGDLLISGAYELITESDIPAEAKVAASRLLAQAIFDVGGGELLDTESVLLPFGEVDALTIAIAKTASYSFVTPLVMAATLSGAKTEVRDMLQTVGVSLGIAFQLADDLLGLFGDEAKTGKPTTSDMAEGKRTYTMQYAVERSNAGDRAELLGILGRGHVSAEQAQRVRELVTKSGALDKTQELMHHYAREAQQALDKLELQPDAHAALTDLIRRAIERQS